MKGEVESLITSESSGTEVRVGQAGAPFHIGGFTPDDLQITGLVLLLTVDWPGQFVASVFCQGCPWRCPYCQNSAILDPKIPGVVAWSAVEDLLSRRHGLLDGVVFSGGEAMRQFALPPAIRRMKKLGFHVGLHTAGAYPKRLETVLEESLVDWVGIDVKAMPENYEQVSGRAGAAEKAWASLDLAPAHPEVAHEVRLIIHPGGLFDGLEVARELKERGVRAFALQQARAFGAPEGFEARGAGWDDRVVALAHDCTVLGLDSFEFHPS